MIKLFAFDLDGTLYLGEKAVPGAVELIQYLIKDYQVVYFTNNSTKTRQQIRDKLKRLNIPSEINQIYTSSSATVAYLREAGLDNLYVIGSHEFRSEVKAGGFKIVDNDSADNLVIGLDTDFNYDKLSLALTILLKGGKFIACNEDVSFPAKDRLLLPACGALVAAISSAAKRKPDFVVGKPNTYILSEISDAFHVKPGEIMVVGDSYESDMAMAIKFRSKAVLIGRNTAGNNTEIMTMKNLKQLQSYLRRRK